MKSQSGLLAGQCDTNDVLGGARERLGVGAREEVLVCGVAVCLGLPGGRSGMGRCPRYRQAICAREYKSTPNTGTDNYTRKVSDK